MADDRITLTTKIVLGLFLACVGVAILPMVWPGIFGCDRAPFEETITTQNRLLAAIAEYKRITGDVPPDDPNQSIAVLLKYLSGAKASDAEVGRKTAKATGPYLNERPTRSWEDAYGHAMRYYRDRGLGGKPLILSAGPDGDFGQSDPQKRRDNIRSDTRE